MGYIDPPMRGAIRPATMSLHVVCALIPFRPRIPNPESQRPTPNAQRPTPNAYRPTPITYRLPPLHASSTYSITGSSPDGQTMPTASNR